MVQHGLDVAFGCASVPLAGDGDDTARVAHLWRRLSSLHLAPPEHRVTPFCPLDLKEVGNGAGADVDVPTPPLIKGYLRCGAQLLGPPAWDAQFRCADLPMLMTLGGLPLRHRRHFLKQQCEPVAA